MRYKTNVSNRRYVAVTKSSSSGVMREHVLNRTRSRVQPVSKPLHSGSVIEAKFMLEILAHSRHYERMRIHCDHLRKRAHVCSRVCCRRQERWLRVLLL